MSSVLPDLKCSSMLHTYHHPATNLLRRPWPPIAFGRVPHPRKVLMSLDLFADEKIRWSMMEYRVPALKSRVTGDRLLNSASSARAISDCSMTDASISSTDILPH